MTSCVVFVFLASLIYFNTAAPPPGIKVRITENAKSLKGLVLMYLKELVNNQFSVEIPYIPIKSMTLTKLQVDTTQVDFKFQEKIGLQLEFKELKFSVEFERELNVLRWFNIIKGTTAFTGEGVSATIPVRMNQNQQGHLNVEIPSDNCIINANKLSHASTGFTGPFWDCLTPLYNYFFNNQMCPLLQRLINNKLKDFTMMRTVHEDRHLHLNYSLSNDIAVTSGHLDISFKGLVSVDEEAVDTDLIRAGKEPVFTETNKMIYVGISEFFFNGAAMAIYKSGPFEDNVPKMKGPKRVVQKIAGIKPGQWIAELTEAPIIEINTTGLSATVNIKAQHKDEQKHFLETCRFKMDIEFKERLLIMNIQEPKCKDETGNREGKRLDFLLDVLRIVKKKLFVKEIPIPLLPELSISDAKTQFEEGYLVVGGSLTFNPQSSSNAGG